MKTRNLPQRRAQVLGLPLVTALSCALLAACQEGDCLEKKTCLPTSVADGGSENAAGRSAGSATSAGGPEEPSDPVITGGSGGAAGGAEPNDAGSGGAAPEPTGTTVGARCEEEGEQTCAGPVSDSVLACTDGRWALEETCARGDLCDSSEPACSPIAAGCERLAPGQAFCEGNELVTCGPDLVTVERELCEGRCASGACVGADCGDGIQGELEECDDGNADDDDECTSECKLAQCGDGHLFARLEECDDGNADDDDECTSECKLAQCGDGFVQAGVEECDDENRVDTDDCLNSCKDASCGDSVIRERREQCDDGNADETDDCPSTCRAPACGDGFVRAGLEECDDAARANGDGCSAECQAEPKLLAVGGEHSCAVLGDGRLKCWGNNDYGQLGTSSDTKVGDESIELGENLPAVLENASAVAAGAHHTCAIQDGSVLCWGDNSAAQLGPGTTKTSSVTPVRIEVGGVPREICAAGTVNAVLLQDGQIKTWGQETPNPTGELMTPGFSTDDVLSIACGERLVCARYAQALICWGVYSEHAPGLREADLSGGAKLAALSVGREHACAVREDGEVVCMGWSTAAALIQDAGGPWFWPDGNLATVSNTGEGAVSVAAGGDSTCVLFENGTLKCWGYGLEGNLGQPIVTSTGGDVVGDTADELGDQLPPIDLGPDARVQSVVTSGNHTCALLDSGRMKCWGLNSSGQLGVGSALSRGAHWGEMGDGLPFAEID